MRVVVAGGAGFLGSHLCDHLLARGDEVLAIDDLSTGTSLNIAHLIDSPAFHFLNADVSIEICLDGEVDAVANLASPASPPAYLARPLQTLAVGSEGTRRLIELAEQHNARFLLASTSEIYGDPKVHPQVEDYWGHVNPIGIRSVYDEAKRFAEALTMAHLRTLGTNVGIARIFNTYGPRLLPGDGRVMSNLISQALLNRPLTVYGDGSQTRSFCYVSDMVSGLVMLLDSQINGPVNLGNPHEITILELAERILRLTKSSSKIVYRELPIDDPVRREPDITLAVNALGWAPKVDLDAGIMNTVEYLKDVAT